MDPALTLVRAVAEVVRTQMLVVKGLRLFEGFVRRPQFLDEAIGKLPTASQMAKNAFALCGGEHDSVPFWQLPVCRC